MSRRWLAGWRHVGEPRAPRRRLFRKYVLTCAALVGATLIVSGALQLWFTFQQTTSDQDRLEREQAATAAATIIQFFSPIEPQLRLADQTLQAGGSLTGAQRSATYAIVLNQLPPITALHDVDANGRERLAVSRVASTAVDSGADFSRAPTFVRARQTGTTAYSPVEFRSASEPYLWLAVPEQGPATDVILAEVNLKFVGDVVSRLTTGQAGYAYVVDGQGKLIAHRDVNLVLQNHDLSGLPQVRAALSEAARTQGPALLGLGQKAATTGRDLQGRQVLSAYQRVDPPGWLVFVDQPLSTAYGPVYSSVVRSVLLLVAGLALAILASLLLVRRMVGPIRTLRASAARLGAGELDQRIVIHTGDELEELGDEFNRMAARLRESYATLESNVEERTRELTDALALLELQSEQLVVANRAKSEFLSRMSHELRTPLNAILGFAEVMELDPQTPPTQQGWIRRMLEAGRHLLGLINEVLDISRIEEGRLSLSLEPVPVDAVVGGVLDMLRSLASRREVELVAPAAGGVPLWVRADRQRVHQVLLNLVTNAIKYNHPGGSVTVTADGASAGRVHVGVHDTGPGIPAEKRFRLFTPFDRLGAEDSGIEGNGLGLAIAKRLVEAMDGAIGVDSEEGAGAAFWIELPRAEALRLEPLLERPGIVAPHDGAGSAATVLYVEDNLSNVEVVKAVFALHPGLTLLSATHGAAGLKLARERRPDLILLDLNLLDMHGDEVLHRLRQDAATRDVPVVVISADATPDQREHTLAEGARAYLTKPLDVRRLLDLLDEVLARPPVPH